MRTRAVHGMGPAPRTITRALAAAVATGASEVHLPVSRRTVPVWTSGSVQGAQHPDVHVRLVLIDPRTPIWLTHNPAVIAAMMAPYVHHFAEISVDLSGAEQTPGRALCAAVEGALLGAARVLLHGSVISVSSAQKGQ